MLVSRNVSREPQKITVADPTFGSVDFFLRRPTFAEMARAQGSYGVPHEYAVAAPVILVGWDGVVSDDDPPKPVPFSAQAFEAQCLAHPWLLVKTLRALSDNIYFPSVREQDLGNSGLPSVEANGIPQLPAGTC